MRLPICAKHFTESFTTYKTIFNHPKSTDRYYLYFKHEEKIFREIKNLTSIA